MAEQVTGLKAQQSISVEAAKQLSITTNTPPQMIFKTPRWFLRMLPWVEVPTGIYRVNRVKMLYDLPKSMKFRYDEKNNLILDAETLQGIPVFKRLSLDFLDKVVSKVKTQTVKAGETLFKENDKGNRFYIILDGRCEVSVASKSQDKQIICTLGEGDFFGEQALLEEYPRKATVTTTTEVQFLYIDRKPFQSLVTTDEIKQSILAVAEARTRDLQKAFENGERRVPVIASQEGEPTIPRSYVDFEKNPTEYHLNDIQTIIGVHTRISELYDVPINQIEPQLRISIEAILEQEEFELINNPEFGLLHTTPANMSIPSRSGAPTPDDFDELLSLVWKNPSIFLCHPRTIAAFGRECTRRGVPPVVVNIMGGEFMTWRGIPLIPCNKLQFREKRNLRAKVSDVLLIRLGEQEQGVVGLRKSSVESLNTPSLSVKYMGINEQSIANYLISKYFGIATLVPDAVARLRNVGVGHYYEYS